LLEPLIPPPRAAKGPGGRPRIDDRAGLEGIGFDPRHRLPLARPATSARLWVRAHRVAAATRVAGRRCMGAAAPVDARRALRRRSPRLVPRLHRQPVGGREICLRNAVTQAVPRAARSGEWGNAFGRSGRRPVGLNRLAPAHPQAVTPTACRDTVVVAGSDFVCGGAACRSW
jgi:hypothetical protein